MNNFNNLRSALSYIELIFVIVIIGILAAVALPRLADTANNARAAMAVSNMSTCIREASNHYGLYSRHIPLGEGYPCDNIKCYTISMSDRNFTVTIDSTDEVYCTKVEAVGGHLAKTYQF